MMLFKHGAGYYEVKMISEADLVWQLSPNIFPEDNHLSRKLSKHHHTEYAYTKSMHAVHREHDAFIIFDGKELPVPLDKIKLFHVCT